MNDQTALIESGHIGAAAEQREPLRWRCHWKVEKRWGDWTGREIDAGLAPEPYELVEGEGNLLVIGGASALWQRFIGSGVTAFDNTNAHLGVGDSNAAAADTQTDLQAATNKTRKPMDLGYPQHTDSTGTSSSKTITYRSTFGTGEANHAWLEWGLFNALSGGRMANRKAENLGTKTSAASWTLSVSLSLA